MWLEVGKKEQTDAEGKGREVEWKTEQEAKQ